MKIGILLFSILMSAHAFAEDVILNCDYQDKYQLQFQLSDNTGWVIEKLPNGKLNLGRSFDLKVIKAAPSGGAAMGLKNSYVLEIPGATVTIDTATSREAGSGKMIHKSGREELLFNCHDND